MKAVYRNTKEVVGAIVEVSSSMKLRSNMRPVSAKLTREDRRLLEEIQFFEAESYDAVESFGPVGVYLKVEVISDTFKGGLQGKLLNLKEVHKAWAQAYDKRCNKGGV